MKYQGIVHKYKALHIHLVSEETSFDHCQAASVLFLKQSYSKTVLSCY